MYTALRLSISSRAIGGRLNDFIGSESGRDTASLPLSLSLAVFLIPACNFFRLLFTLRPTVSSRSPADTEKFSSASSKLHPLRIPKVSEGFHPESSISISIYPVFPTHRVIFCLVSFPLPFRGLMATVYPSLGWNILCKSLAGVSQRRAQEQAVPPRRNTYHPRFLREPP